MTREEALDVQKAYPNLEFARVRVAAHLDEIYKAMEEFENQGRILEASRLEAYYEGSAAELEDIDMAIAALNT